MGRLEIIETIVSDMIGFRRQNRIGVFSTAEPSSKTSKWKTWVTYLKLTTCDYCFEQRGKIFSHENELEKKPPVHDYCGCKIETLTSIKAGTATKDRNEGADWYLYYQSTLPDYYISKSDAYNLGWEPQKGNLWEVAEGKYIFGGIYRNRNNKLPDQEGRIWYECDIDYEGGFRNNSRIVFSNDGLIFVTYDHYRTFFEIGE